MSSCFSRFLLVVVLGVLTSCSTYSTATKQRLTYSSPTPAGQLIAHGEKLSPAEPLAQLGAYLDATAAASAVLAKQPGDTQARADYNFAVARIFEIISDAGLEPWKAPVRCPGASQEWNLSFKTDPRPDHNPANYSLVSPDRYRFKGKLVVQQDDKAGLGASLIARSKVPDATQIDPFAQGKHIYYGVTGLADVKGNNATLTLYDPLSVENVSMDGHTYPLAANFTAPIALALAELKPRKRELGGLFKPDEFATGPRLARLQPYDPKKIPILCIHGLGDSQATWAPMIESLRSDPVIRENYQIWFFSYASGYPYPASAAFLRQKMDLINARYPDHKKIVVLGHSMGGMISRTLMTDSGMKLWYAIYDKSPEETPFENEETRKLMTDALIFKHRPEISRVTFLSPSHRGADMATNFFGRLGSKLIGGPKNLLKGDTSALAVAKPNSRGAHLKKMPNSIDFLDPENRFVVALAELPLAPGIPFHSILGDRGKGGNKDRTKPVSSDGIVPYWSSHLDGAESEVIIPSGHWTNQHPQGIAEVRRILYQHLGKELKVVSQ
ncbi:alpha/beta fold hydrolase [Roseimicrobium sp. ORNL1]|uniref:lipase family alpha/beta hydrolase n=1 Tax=Roseimicrobium sp. ORNL1 TaxID=2711231 RepID=UPI0013E13174|nr:alpha/beta fold hydrolase [Roseimicrobium sp. ORNL1]QIF03628.1 alpha/beta hydrolase [Roseimicrobium sp. ORNL1]